MKQCSLNKNLGCKQDLSVNMARHVYMITLMMLLIFTPADDALIDTEGLCKPHILRYKSGETCFAIFTDNMGQHALVK